MIVTPRWVFLHLHKSGGTFVNECLLRFVGDARQLGYHLPRSMLPAGFAALPVLGFVRNPWSYYVSWFGFQRALPQPNALFRVLSDDGRLDFAGLNLGDDNPLLARLMSALPNRYGQQGLNLPNFALAAIRGSQLGFYSFLYGHIFGGAGGAAVIGRLEELRDVLPSMLEQASESVAVEMRQFIATGASRNSSTHGSYRDYYDRQLRELVATRDAGLIGRYGYRFE